YRTDKNGENPVCIAHNITGTSFTDTDWHDTDARYYVVSNCTVDGYLRQSPISNVVFIGSSAVGEITAAQKVSAGFGVINVENFAGEPVVIAAADGKVVVSGKVASNNYSYSIDKGIYLVTIGKKTYKVVVK
ncbi:MAG: hypothetical protein K2K29_05910, partial [Muribaculaceae bacterium]|nr:hypothetical protein [Muribaculaceae bacterium]